MNALRDYDQALAAYNAALREAHAASTVEQIADAVIAVARTRQTVENLRAPARAAEAEWERARGFDAAEGDS
jgi:hypothetical protein